MAQSEHTDQRHFMADWADQLTAELELDCDAATSPDLKSLLDVTRLIAHNFARPAGPIATYYIGLAAGLAAGDPRTAERATALITELINAHIAQQSQEQQSQENTLPQDNTASQENTAGEDNKPEAE